MGVDTNRIHFTSYCWSLGTTSFRMQNFNYQIERQLELLHEFFMFSENEKWEGNEMLQTKYYDFMKEKNFISGDAKNKPKDARQKTSGLVALGLVNKERRLTKVGYKIIDIFKKGVFKSHNDNFFGVDKDSYIYLLQLLKYTTDEHIRPFVVVLKVLNELNTISQEEFKYILPLVINKEVAKTVVEEIKKLRNRYTSIEEIIINLIWNMDNYQAAFEYFIYHKPTQETFEIIGMNRKSPMYEKPYAMLYEKLIEVYVRKNTNAIIQLYDAIDQINGKAKGYWKKLIFKKGNRRQISKEPQKYIQENKLSSIAKSEFEIKKYIFEMMHLFKWKSTLDDYYDLNRRYMKLSDIIIFQDNQVELTLLAKEYFKYCIDDFFEASFIPSTDFDKVISIENILGDYIPNLEYVYTSIAAYFDEEYIASEDIQSYVENERLNRFNELIDEHFNDEKLIELLNYFEERNDTKLHETISDNADAPTMFEYILGIIWYKLSERKGNILEYMNLSLDASLLPKTHAKGGDADIVYLYDACATYPSHEVLLEATLVDDRNQRRMEIEPVSRHLMKNLMDTNNLDNYAILISTYIHPSVISDFRSKAKTEQTLNNQIYFNGIKILAIDTKIIKNYIRSKKTYKDIYQLLEDAYHSDISLQAGWYQKEIEEKSK